MLFTGFMNVLTPTISVNLILILQKEYANVEQKNGYFLKQIPGFVIGGECAH